MRFLIIQTAFLGDVILASSVAEKLHHKFPDSQIDFLLKKGNEEVFEGHPFIKNILVLDKKHNKIKNILSLARKVKSNQYDCIINLNRFGSSGFIVWRSKAKEKIGFDKNPFSFCYTKKIKHEIGNGKHETERNHTLIADITDSKPAKPKLYPSLKHIEAVKQYTKEKKYVCVAPASIWFTKQFSKEKWIELIKELKNTSVYLIGSKNDIDLCNYVIEKSKHGAIVNLAGKLSILETAALMQTAEMNYVNDSAPLHIASATNAPVTAIYCSTIPAFGFGPLSDRSIIIETKEKLDCRPCGLHGHTSCPKEHFKCSESIEIKNILNV